MRLLRKHIKKRQWMLVAAAFVLLGALAAVLLHRGSITTPYRFPVTPDGPEWAGYSKSQIVARSQIPEGQLHRMTTAALLESVLVYPYFTDFMAYNTYEDAAKALAGEFNGFRAFCERDDRMDALLDAYRQSGLSGSGESPALSSAESGEHFFRVAGLRYLISVEQGYTEREQLERFLAEQAA